MKEIYADEILFKIKKNGLIADIQFKKILITVFGVFNIVFVSSSFSNETNVTIFPEDIYKWLIGLVIVFSMYNIYILFLHLKEYQIK